MPRKSIGAALVQDALQDEEQDLAEPAAATTEVKRVASVDVQAIVTAVVAAMAQSGVSQADAIAGALKEAVSVARQPIPEGTDASNPRKSVFNPEGEAVAPRPGLVCPTFMGIYDDDGKIAPAFEMIEDNCTKREQELLNQVTQGEYRVERNDGVIGLVKVQVRTDLNGKPTRKILALPHGWLGRDQFAQVPTQVRLCEQVIAGAAHA